MRKYALQIVFCAVAALAAAASALAELQMERNVNLRAEAEVWSQDICLHNIVDDFWIRGRCQVDKSACCLWTLEGQLEKQITKAEIQKAISEKFSSRGTAPLAIKVSGAQSVRVVQTKRMLNEEEIHAKVAESIPGKHGGKFAGVAVSDVRLTAPVYVSVNATSLDSVRVEAPDSISDVSEFKIYSSDSPNVAIGSVRARIELFGEVFVAARDIGADEALVREDFELKATNMLNRSSAKNLFAKDSFPEGTKTKLRIAKGTPLSANAIEKIPMVKLGDSVNLILRSDNLRISTKGVAQGSAALGDMLTVTLRRYNRSFRGKLVEGKAVEVWL